MHPAYPLAKGTDDSRHLCTDRRHNNTSTESRGELTDRVGGRKRERGVLLAHGGRAGKVSPPEELFQLMDAKPQLISLNLGLGQTGQVDTPSHDVGGRTPSQLSSQAVHLRLQIRVLQRVYGGSGRRESFRGSAAHLSWPRA